MSDTHLPDDLADWPRDPFALLGVDAGETDEKAIRRAYVKLLRRFKPDHHPEHFQRIHLAYEAIMQQLQWRRWAVSGSERGEAEPTPISVVEQPDRTAAPAPPVADDVLRRLDVAWRFAEQGLSDRAYDRLLDMHRDLADGCEDLYVRLYWMLRIEPSLDKGREAINWLVVGLRHFPRSETLLALYARHLYYFPPSALGAHFLELFLQYPENDRPLGLLRNRWTAAWRLKRLDIICGDASRLGLDRIEPHQEGKFQPAFWAIDHLAWSDEETCRQWVLNLSDQLLKLHDARGRYESALDRMEYLAEIVRRWFRCRQDRLRYGKLIDFLSDWWVLPTDHFAWAVLPLLVESARRPIEKLSFWDFFANGYPILCGLLVEMVEEIDGYLSTGRNNDDRDGEQIQAKIARFVQHLSVDDLGQFRRNILLFCLQEVIHPRYVAQWLMANDPYPDRRNSILGDRIYRDGPVQLVYAIQRVVWHD